MSTTDLALIDVPHPEPRSDNGVGARLHDLRNLIASASAEQLVEMAIFAEAVAATARARQAATLIREAVDTRLRAERRLGELLLADESLYARLPTIPVYCDALAIVPIQLFERALSDLFARDKACGDKRAAARTVLAKARQLSLKKVEPRLWVAYDGSYYSKRSDGRWTRRIAYDINAARAWVREWEPRRKSSRRTKRLDQAYASARVLAHDLSRMGSAFTGIQRTLIADAELLAAQAAEALDRARRLAL